MNRYINLVASASYPFPEVLHAQSHPIHVFPNEGLPGKRFFPASQSIDAIELEAHTLLRSLFRYGTAFDATIQPHSATQVNQIVYDSVLGSDDCVLSLEASHGGHISHSLLVGRSNPVVHYHVTPEGLMDYEEIEFLARKHKPRLIVAGASAYPRSINYERLAKTAHEVGSFLHGDISHTALFVMTGIHDSVFPHVDFAGFNMMKNLRGPSGGILIYRLAHKKRIARSLFPVTQSGSLQSVLFAKLAALTCIASMDRRAYAEQIVLNARTIASAFIEAGFPVVSNGTDSHLVLIDISPTGLTGAAAEMLCEEQGVLVNRNLVPGDKHGALVTSGLRLGTACITILGALPDDARALTEALICLLTDSDCVTEYFDRFRDSFMNSPNIASVGKD
jgi:glycine hydroxymethyltransferase